MSGTPFSRPLATAVPGASHGPPSLDWTLGTPTGSEDPAEPLHVVWEQALSRVRATLQAVLVQAFPDRVAWVRCQVRMLAVRITVVKAKEKTCPIANNPTCLVKTLRATSFADPHAPPMTVAGLLAALNAQTAGMPQEERDTLLVSAGLASTTPTPRSSVQEYYQW
ncbi:hypothetical protein B0I35DRAFT_483272 [Stachybotrys elegans]|uniref:Uncharacterized protein n=1 Tax=Stachybotrys elegans TaxID=80388 RepID=A0A8K0SC40_9HYPO|nr:hypothetical protein B0I35DRAFT_483272 [Stachybotrys elegans]